ncbi:4522_t:CDS:10 [Paraglomus brasilianum]|uniref:4522_t:CDS:1 n=1 Tax=Paraglomus brasilianum TaxID=144538 RepID=A0A9N8VK65_9GLOM|nr:4522_t:CDS:10 [Paraglomus brasilianum]
METPYVDNAVKALGIISIALFLKYMFQTIYVAYFGPLSKIPGPKLSALSTIPLLFRGTNGKRWYWYQRELRPKYGKIIRIGPDIVLVNDKDIIKQIIVKEDWPKGDFYKIYRAAPHLQTLFSTTDKAFHKQRRRLLAPAFSIKYIQSLEPYVAKCIRNLNDKIDSLIQESSSTDGAVIDLYRMLINTTLDSIGETAFGGSFNMIGKGHHPLPKEVFVELSKRMLRNGFPIFKPFVKSNQYLYDFSSELIKRRRQEVGVRRKDILQIILDAGEGEAALADIDIYEQIIEFLVGGSDTTSYSTFFALLMLLTHPSKLHKLIEELDNEFVDLPRNELPKHEKLKNLPYLNAVINETLRLWPISLDGGSGRSPTEDKVVNGVLFPKGTLILTNYYALHHSAEYWGKDVNEFVPERWFNDDIPRDAFYPFSAGSRNCIGQNFAWFEMRLIISSLLRRFRFEDIPGQNYSDIVHIVTPSLAQDEYKVRAWNRP